MWEKIIEFLATEAQCESEIREMVASKTDADRLHYAHRIAAKREICTWLETTIKDLIRSQSEK
jgi:hypothetical protein